MPFNDIAKGSAADWLRHARSDLAMAEAGQAEKDVLPESLCFHAQQAAEKALKAVLISANVEFPRTHNIKSLTELLPDTVPRAAILDDAATLTEYAVATRYPAETEPVTEDEFREALQSARGVVAWAQSIAGN